VLWYYVIPCSETKWNILFDGQSRRPYPYDSADEAIKAACRAAEIMRRKQQTPTGVRLKAGDDWREAVRFG
jgi:hypothetical protein